MRWLQKVLSVKNRNAPPRRFKIPPGVKLIVSIREPPFTKRGYPRLVLILPDHEFVRQRELSLRNLTEYFAAISGEYILLEPTSPSRRLLLDVINEEDRLVRNVDVFEEK